MITSSHARYTAASSRIYARHGYLPSLSRCRQMIRLPRWQRNFISITMLFHVVLAFRYWIEGFEFTGGPGEWLLEALWYASKPARLVTGNLALVYPMAGPRFFDVLAWSAPVIWPAAVFIVLGWRFSAGVVSSHISAAQKIPRLMAIVAGTCASAFTVMSLPFLAFWFVPPLTKEIVGGGAHTPQQYAVQLAREQTLEPILGYLFAAAGVCVAAIWFWLTTHVARRS